ncbi:MAG TPA: peptide chain release factor N(5)-glutamine methyltransferase [Candidatus Limnocylindria bacterium]|nr:peptide chain release factor N(5)-glutamine methyltransferase [Candidatus Limnocylindria bacterium]
MPGTIEEALRSAASRLSTAESPRGEAEELIGRLLDLRRTEIHLQRARLLTAEQWDRLDSWLRRRAHGEPLQYITGRAAFRGLDLHVSHAVLIPRPETEGLVESVLGVLREELVRWPAPRIVDLGTGSGAIALALAVEWPEAIVTATDASPAALELARGNAAALGLEERIRFLEGDWLDAVPADERFEVVVSNPPYIATGEWDLLPEDVREFEPQEALFSGSSGLEAMREIVDRAPEQLVTGGLLALELAEARAHEAAAWLEGAHDWEHVRLLDDLAGRPRVLLARRQSGPAIAPAQWPEEPR